jgi:hypothetical protein
MIADEGFVVSSVLIFVFVVGLVFLRLCKLFSAPCNTCRIGVINLTQGFGLLFHKEHTSKNPKPLYNTYTPDNRGKIMPTIWVLRYDMKGLGRFQCIRPLLHPFL